MSTQTIFLTAGSTSKTVDIALVQNAASTSPGDPILNLAFNTASLKCYYRAGATGTLTVINLVTQTVGGAYSSGGFVKIDDTNAAGLYRFDIPNAVIATAGEANIVFSGAPAGTVGNMATHTVKVIVTAMDFYFSTWTGQLTESYAADGVAPTGTQALFQIMQFLHERSISGTTQTAKKLDGTTTAMTFTLNDSANPSSISRTT